MKLTIKSRIYLSLFIVLAIIISCKQTKEKSNKLQIVTTTSIVTDLVTNIGKDKVEIKGLMGAGVDPHLYKASEGDVSKLFNADVVIYNGLHLEGKLEDVFEKLHHQNKKTIAISNGLDKSELISSKQFASNYDPHIWFGISNWKQMIQYVANQLSEIDVQNKEYYQKNATEYLKEIKETEAKIVKKIAELPVEKRILVTAHDAFNYFGKEFNFQVVGLQGLSTATEAGVKDVRELANFIINNNVKAVFVESSVPKRTIEALKAAVVSKKHHLTVGGTLFSDALGTKGTKEGTYTGMYEYNVNTIVNALK